MPESIPLRDIHLPAAIGWWPPAPGWWALAVLLLLAVAALGVAVARHYSRRRVLARHALAELQAIERRHAARPDAAALSQSLSALLRRVAMSAQTRKAAAAVTGAAWLRHLDALAGETMFDNAFGRGFIDAAYRPRPDIDAAALLTLCRDWIVKVGQNKGGKGKVENKNGGEDDDKNGDKAKNQNGGDHARV